MSDDQLPRIVLPPTSDLTGSAPPPLPSQPRRPAPPTPIVQANPPTASAPAPMPMTPLASAQLPTKAESSAAQVKQHHVDLQQQLDAINKEENTMLSTIKEWIAWMQGAETKKQAIERELRTLNQTAQTETGMAAPTGPTRQEIEQQLRAADAQVKAIQDRQKIDEKKAFDHYASGGINREGLMKTMDEISEHYHEQLTAAKTAAAGWREQLQKMSAPTAAPAAVPVAMPAATVAPTAATRILIEKILERLRTLERAQAGEVRHVLVELPQQGQPLSVQRSADGNGIIVLAGTEAKYTAAHHFPDADLLRAGLGINDVVNLPTGQLTGAQLAGSQNNIV